MSPSRGRESTGQAEILDLLSRIRRIEIKTSRLARQQMAGQYRSVFKGHGMSFEEVRPYQQGDDVRAIDWNVSARTGEPFVKVFVEERELTVFLLLDLSRSSLFGTTYSTRRDYISEIAAALAFSAIRNNDRVGLILFTDEVKHFVPPRKGRIHVLRVIRDVLEFSSGWQHSSTTGITDAVGYLMRITKKPSKAFLLTDGFVSEADTDRFERSLSVASKRHDFTAIVVQDPMDAKLPSAGLVTLEDIETGEMLLVDSSSAGVRKRFSERAARDVERVCEVFNRLSIDNVVLTIGQDYASALRHLFGRRAKRY